MNYILAYYAMRLFLKVVLIFLLRANQTSRYIINIKYGGCLNRFVSANYSELRCFVILNEVKNPVF